MPMRDSEICYGNEPYAAPIKIWQNGEVVLSSDELKVELKNIILNIKGDVIQIENKNKIEDRKSTRLNPSH